MKRRENFTAYETMPKYMAIYMSHFGPHFNKKLCEFAVSQMYKVDDDGREEDIKPYSKTDIKSLMTAYNVRIKNDVLYDAVYVAAMCKADYLGSSVKGEEELIKYVKDTLDDPDAIEGLVFNRWVGDMKWLGVPIDWEDML